MSASEKRELLFAEVFESYKYSIAVYCVLKHGVEYLEYSDRVQVNGTC